MNQYNNCCLYSLKSKHLVSIKIARNYLLSPFFYAIISSYTNTEKS